MELFGIALDALPESDEYAVKLNPVSEDDEGGGNDDEGESDAEADAPATSSTSLGMPWSFQCDEHGRVGRVRRSHSRMTKRRWNGRTMSHTTIST